MKKRDVLLSRGSLNNDGAWRHAPWRTWGHIQWRTWGHTIAYMRKHTHDVFKCGSAFPLPSLRELVDTLTTQTGGMEPCNDDHFELALEYEDMVNLQTTATKAMGKRR